MRDAQRSSPRDPAIFLRSHAHRNRRRARPVVVRGEDRCPPRLWDDEPGQHACVDVPALSFNLSGADRRRDVAGLAHRCVVDLGTRYYRLEGADEVVQPINDDYVIVIDVDASSPGPPPAGRDGFACFAHLSLALFSSGTAAAAVIIPAFSYLATGCSSSTSGVNCSGGTRCRSSSSSSRCGPVEGGATAGQRDERARVALAEGLQASKAPALLLDDGGILGVHQMLLLLQHLLLLLLLLLRGLHFCMHVCLARHPASSWVENML